MATVVTHIKPTPNKKPLSPRYDHNEVDMNRVAAIVLGGGQGSRLFPLTLTRCKPAITFGGKYRLIDVPISNSLNSFCHKIFVVTQFLSTSLHHHIHRTYRLDGFSSGFIEILTAEQKPYTNSWFQGTADAVRQNLDYFVDTPADYFLILSGDQLYHLNFQEMMRVALTTEADVVVAAQPVDEAHAKRMGLLKVNVNDRVTDFVEKPQEKEVLDQFTAPLSILERANVSAKSGRNYLGSMGIYLFKRETLLNLLLEDNRDDFGKHLIPNHVENGHVAAYIHNSYWEDIGTIDAFHQANIELTSPYPAFNCYAEDFPIFTDHEALPSPKILGGRLDQSIICEGAIVDAEEIAHSIIGPRTVVRKGSVIERTYIMGNDFYTPPSHNPRYPQEVVIEENCIIQNAIIDKNVHLGKGVRLINARKLTNFDSEKLYVRDGIIVIPRGVSLPDGFVF
ncbi:MAG: glucose-1-phosphate adenylyltransferase [Chlamydiia bacterium]|nr:glucose-1-phosphate adenylyltransferase [Chlamydiia bacterium]